MLFLWLFGAALEGRLRPIKFIILYMLAGYAGWGLHDQVFGSSEPDRFSLGASGSVMGLMGAYLFVFPYARICVVYSFFFYFRGVFDVQARWVALIFLGREVWKAYSAFGDGVGHFAHLGGAIVGILMVLLLKTPRDSERASEAQEIASEQDYDLLNLDELESLLQSRPDNLKLVRHYLDKLCSETQRLDPNKVVAFLLHYSPMLLEAGEAQGIGTVMLHLPVESSKLRVGHGG